MTIVTGPPPLGQEYRRLAGRVSASATITGATPNMRASISVAA